MQRNVDRLLRQSEQSSLSFLPSLLPPAPWFPQCTRFLPAHPHQLGLTICCFVYAENRSRGGSSNTLRSRCLFLPAVQLAAWVAGTNSPALPLFLQDAHLRSARVSPLGCVARRPSPQGLLQVGRENVVPRVGLREKGERSKEKRKRDRDREKGEREA